MGTTNSTQRNKSTTSTAFKLNSKSEESQPHCKLGYFSALPQNIISINIIANELTLTEISNISRLNKYSNEVIFADQQIWQAKLQEVYGIDILEQNKILKNQESPEDLFKLLSHEPNHLSKFIIADLKFLMQQKKLDKSKYTDKEALQFLGDRYNDCPKSKGVLCTEIAGIELSTIDVQNKTDDIKNLCIRTLMITENLNFNNAEAVYNSIDNALKYFIGNGFSRSDIEQLRRKDLTNNDIKEISKDFDQAVINTLHNGGNYDKNNKDTACHYDLTLRTKMLAKYPSLKIKDLDGIRYFNTDIVKTIKMHVLKGKTPKQAIKILKENNNQAQGIIAKFTSLTANLFKTE